MSRNNQSTSHTPAAKPSNPNKAEQPGKARSGHADGDADNLGSMTVDGTRVMQRWVAGSKELARFYQIRMMKDLNMMSEFAACRTPQDFTDVWIDAFRNVAQDYSEEFQRMMSINLSDEAAELDRSKH